MIDTHCHLLLEEYQSEEHLKEVISHMENHFMITSATNMRNIVETLNTVKKYPNVYGVIGIHPEEVEEGTEDNLKYLELHLHDEKIVGIGEIGLDYHYTKENREKQIALFEKQLELAKKYHLPCVIHSRDAAQDTYNILRKVVDGSFPVILHCYGYSVEMAREFLKLGVYFGIGGVVTFKNGVKLVEVVKEMPLDHLLLETDSPYLSPEPYRGRENEPARIIHIASKIAQIKNISLEKVLEITTNTAITQFDLKK